MVTRVPQIQDWIIDSDTHVSEPGDLWTSRVPARFKDRAPHIVRDPETGIDTWRIGETQGYPVGEFATAGWPEPLIIVRFWIISVICALVTIGTLKLR